MNKTIIRPAARPANILVVDDEGSLTQLIDEILSMQGHKVTTCQNSVVAYNLFHQNPEKFELMITDQVMPDMSGDKLVKEILKMRPDLPIIMCTAYSEVIDKEAARAIGIKGFLNKPIDIEDFLNQVETLVAD